MKKNSSESSRAWCHRVSVPLQSETTNSWQGVNVDFAAPLSGELWVHIVWENLVSTSSGIAYVDSTNFFPTRLSLHFFLFLFFFCWGSPFCLHLLMGVRAKVVVVALWCCLLCSHSWSIDVPEWGNLEQ